MCVLVTGMQKIILHIFFAPQLSSAQYNINIMMIIYLRGFDPPECNFFILGHFKGGNNQSRFSIKNQFHLNYRTNRNFIESFGIIHTRMQITSALHSYYRTSTSL